MAKRKTPMLDELEKGKWPSFVSDIKQEAEWRNKTDVDLQTPKEVCDDLLDLLELSFKDQEGHWKHGGVAGVFGYGGGVIGRYCDQPEEFPAVKDFHTLRVNQPSSYFYKTDFLRQMCELWERRGSGITNMHGSTGDIILLGTTTPQLEEIFWELTHNLKQDLGGSGSNLRSPNCCIGKSRCEFACYDTQEACRNFTMEYQDELHRPSFGYKFKMKFDGCPNGCVASIARSDMSVIGTWKDDIRIDQEAVRAYVGGEFKPDGGAHRRPRLGTLRYRQRGDRSVSHPLHGLEWKQARDQQQGVQPVHALHQHDAPGPEDRNRDGGLDSVRRQSPDSGRRAAFDTDHTVHADGRAVQ